MFLWPQKPIRIFNIQNWLKSISAEDWLVQPKMNGKRVLPFCNLAGQITLFGRQNQIFPAKDWQFLKDLPLARPWLLDGELVPACRNNQVEQMMVWDFGILGGKELINDAYLYRSIYLNNLNWNNPFSQLGPINLVKNYAVKNYSLILKDGPSKSLEGCVFKYLFARDFWSQTKTSEIANMFKFKF